MLYHAIVLYRCYMFTYQRRILMISSYEV